MGFGGVAVPDGEGFAGFRVFPGDALVEGEDGILLADGLGFREQGAVAGVGFAGGFALPLEVTDPEDELGDGDGVVGEFETEELLGADLVFVHLEGCIAAEGGDELEHLGFEAFHVLEGDVEEIRGAAGGIEHLDGAEVAVEGGDELEGFGVFPFRLGAELGGGGSDFHGGGGGSEGFDFPVHFVGGVLGGFGGEVEAGGGDADGFPFLAQRLDDGGADEALDVGARGVFRAELVALAGIEGAGEEGAEDGWLYLRPIGGGGIGEHFQLRGGEEQGGGVFEKPAVEVGDFLEEERGVLGAGGHFLPQGGDEDGEALRGGFHFL